MSTSYMTFKDCLTDKAISKGEKYVNECRKKSLSDGQVVALALGLLEHKINRDGLMKTDAEPSLDRLLGDSGSWTAGGVFAASVIYALGEPKAAAVGELNSLLFESADYSHYELMAKDGDGIPMFPEI